MLYNKQTSKKPIKNEINKIYKIIKKNHVLLNAIKTIKNIFYTHVYYYICT